MSYMNYHQGCSGCGLGQDEEEMGPPVPEPPPERHMDITPGPEQEIRLSSGETPKEVYIGGALVAVGLGLLLLWLVSGVNKLR